MRLISRQAAKPQRKVKIKTLLKFLCVFAPLREMFWLFSGRQPTKLSASSALALGSFSPRDLRVRSLPASGVSAVRSPFHPSASLRLCVKS